MASSLSARIALLPIKAHYVELLISGEKKVEFRRVRFRYDLAYAVIYACRPIRGVVGYFQICHIDEDSPEALWTRYRQVGGISYEEFKRYFAGTQRGVALGVGKVYTLRVPLQLSRLRQSLTPPQSFLYLSKKTFDEIQALHSDVPNVAAAD